MPQEKTNTLHLSLTKYLKNPSNTLNKKVNYIVEDCFSQRRLFQSSKFRIKVTMLYSVEIKVGRKDRFF